jgi:hypothetical protein
MPTIGARALQAAHAWVGFSVDQAALLSTPRCSRVDVHTDADAHAWVCARVFAERRGMVSKPMRNTAQTIHTISPQALHVPSVLWRGVLRPRSAYRRTAAQPPKEIKHQPCSALLLASHPTFDGGGASAPCLRRIYRACVLHWAAGR